MKKILFIVNNMEGGGAERVFMNIANGFVQHNIAVEFLLGKKSGVYLQSLHPSIKVHEIGSINFFAYCKGFPGIFKKNNYTHIFTASHYVSAAAILVKKRMNLKAKIFQTLHSCYPARRELKYWKGDMVLKALFFSTAPLADKIIAVSNGSLRWMRQFSHRKLPQGSVIYNPVFDDSIYSLAKEEVSFPVNTVGKTILLTAGRLSEIKDHLSLIKAFEIYRKKNKDALLFILGVGPLESSLKKYVAERKLEEEVFFPGFQQNPYKWMARCDVFILSSKHEGFGNVIAEAIALGKTVVSTDCPAGPAEILDNGRLGYLCSVHNPVTMAAAIEKAIKHPLDKNTLISASTQYRTDIILKKYIEALQ